jgi:Na+-transporting NADH:ubiquinone oxidoreductase subunit F
MTQPQKTTGIENKTSNQRQCTIKINDDKELQVSSGKSLLASLISQKIFVPTACGGQGKCRLCKLKVLEGAGAFSEIEERALSDTEKQSNVRLSCQVKVQNDLKVIVPAEYFSIKTYKCKCVSITDLNYDTKQFRFELLEPDNIDYTPGQYMQILTPAYEKSSERTFRAYSISSDPADKKYIEFVIRYVPNGICTTYCFKYLKIGDTVRINGPYGNFTLCKTDAPIVFIAGASGIAPVKCMLHCMKNTGSKRKAVFYFGGNAVKDLYYFNVMQQFEKELPDFRFVPTVAKPLDGETWNGKTGLVTQVVREELANAAQYEAYLCGSPGMIDASVKVLKEMGIKEENIFYDKY